MLLLYYTVDGLISRLDAAEVAQQKMLTEPPSPLSLPVEHPSVPVDTPSFSHLDPECSDLGSLLSESGI